MFKLVLEKAEGYQRTSCDRTAQKSGGEELPSLKVRGSDRERQVATAQEQ